MPPPHAETPSATVFDDFCVDVFLDERNLGNAVGACYETSNDTGSLENAPITERDSNNLIAHTCFWLRSKN